MHAERKTNVYYLFSAAVFEANPVRFDRLLIVAVARRERKRCNRGKKRRRKGIGKSAALPRQSTAGHTKKALDSTETILSLELCTDVKPSHYCYFLRPRPLPLLMPGGAKKSLHFVCTQQILPARSSSDLYPSIRWTAFRAVSFLRGQKIRGDFRRATNRRGEPESIRQGARTECGKNGVPFFFCTALGNTLVQ